MRRKISKFLLILLFIIGSIFAIKKRIINYSNDGLVFIVLAFTMLFFHLFASIAPKTFFNICWKITKFLPDRFDYDASYRNLEITSMGVLIAADIFLGIGFLIGTLPK